MRTHFRVLATVLTIVGLLALFGPGFARESGGNVQPELDPMEQDVTQGTLRVPVGPPAQEGHVKGKRRILRGIVDPIPPPLVCGIHVSRGHPGVAGFKHV